MKKSVLGTALLMLFASLPAGLAHAAGQQTTPPGDSVQQVQDKDVFAQVQTLVEQSGKNTTAVTNMDTTLKSAVTRTRAMGNLADTKGMRIEIPATDELDAEIEEVSGQVEKLRCAKFIDAKQLARCKQVELSTINLIKMLKKNLKSSQTRATTIQTLLGELNKIGDTNLKEAADLQARIQTEIALLQNEKTMVDMAIVKNEQQVRLYNQLLFAFDKDNPGDPAGNSFNIK